MSSRSYSADSLNPFNRSQNGKVSPAKSSTQDQSHPSKVPVHAPCSQFLLKKSGELCFIKPTRLVPKPRSLARKGRKLTAGFLRMLGLQSQLGRHNKPANIVSHLDRLPTELLDLVIGNLDHNSVLRMSEVSRRYHQLCRTSDRPWQRLFADDFAKGKIISNKHSLTNYELYRDHHILEQRMRSGKAHVTYLEDHKDTVYCVAHFNGRLVSGGRDDAIKIWDMETGECIDTKQSHPYHNGSVLRLKSYADRLISCSSDGTAIVWSTDFTPLFYLLGHNGRVLDACQAGSYFVTSSSDENLRVWDSKGKQIRCLPTGGKYINAMSAYGSIVALASSTSTIRLYDVERDVFLNAIKDPSDVFTSVHFDGRYIYAAGSDAAVKIWDASTGQRVQSGLESRHSDVIRSLAVSGDKVITGGYDEKVRIWDVATGRCLVTYNFEDPSWVMCVYAHNNRIFSAGHKGQITMFNYGYDLQAFS